MQKKISFVLCILNERKNLSNINRNIEFLKGQDIIIVDGGSTDNTVKELQDNPYINFIQLKNQGLLKQRVEGIKNAKNDIVFLFDSDDELKNLDITALSEELKSKNVDGIQIKANSCGNYWESSWGAYFQTIHFEQNSEVLGRPSVTYKKFYTSLNITKNIFCEDTFLKFEHKKRYGKLKYCFSNQLIVRKSPKTFYSSLMQFYKYGKSDSSIIDSKEKLLDLLYHSLIRITVLRTFTLIKLKLIIYAPFVFLMGLARSFGIMIGLISRKVF